MVRNFAVFVCMLCALTLMVGASPSNAQTSNIIDSASSDGRFATFVTAASAAGIDTVLSGTGPFTVFIPTDTAFNALPSGTLSNLLLPENKDTLSNLLLYHTVSGALSSTDVISSSVAISSTTTQQLISFSVVNGTAFVDSATISQTDIAASNGTIHVLDAVLSPAALANVVETASNAGSFTTLTAALQATGLDTVLSGTGPFTVFAPDDAAFAALPAGSLDLLLADTTTLSSILTYHVVSGKLTDSAVASATQLVTVNGATLTVTSATGGVLVDNATITAVNTDANNGIIHTINSVLVPEGVTVPVPTATPTPVPTSTPTPSPTVTPVATSIAVGQTVGPLSLAGGASGLWYSFTVETPGLYRIETAPVVGTTPADTFLTFGGGGLEATASSGGFGFFAALDVTLAANETYFVRVTNTGTTTGSYTLSITQLPDPTATSTPSPTSTPTPEIIVPTNTPVPTATEVPEITPTPEPTSTPESTVTPTPAAGPNIVEIAAGLEQFSTLVTALEAADLLSTLSGDGPFTVFAPTNDAFAALEPGVLDSLLLPENVDQLTNILLYHVLPGQFFGADVAGLSVAKTLTSNQQLVTFTDGTMINNASITATDTIGSNGVIHIIDTVLIPETLPNIVETAAGAGTFTTLVAALQATDLDDTLSGPGPFTVFAPTDEAFAKLPAGLLDALLLPENESILAQILTYHVANGKLISNDVVATDSIPTINGNSVAVSIVDGVVFVDQSAVTTVNLDTSNGVIHVIDTVLIPAGLELPDFVAPTPTAPVTATPTPTATPTATLVPTETPLPIATPTEVPVANPEVLVYDTPTSTENLAGTTDFDTAEERSLTITTNANTGDATNWHFYMRQGFGGFRFLGQTFSGDVKTLTWTAGAEGIAPRFSNGPSFNSSYEFRVIRLDGDLGVDDIVDISAPVGLNVEGDSAVVPQTSVNPVVPPNNIVVTDDLLGLLNLAPTGSSGTDVDAEDNRAVQIVWDFGMDADTVSDYQVFVSVNGGDAQFLGQTQTGDLNYFWWTPNRFFQTNQEFWSGPQGGNTYQFTVFMIPLEGQIRSRQSGILTYTVE